MTAFDVLDLVVNALSLGATGWLAWIASKFSERSTRQQVRQNVNDQLKAYNLAILQNQEFAEFTLRSRFPKGDRNLDFVRSLSVVHYRMNLLCDLYYADKEAVFCNAMIQYEFSDWVRSLVRTHQEALIFVLSGVTLIGHPAEFLKEFCKHLPDGFPGKETDWENRVRPTVAYAAATASISSSHFSS